MVTLRTGERRSNVTMGVHKPEGELTWISINSVPLLSDAGVKAHGVITTFHDVTVIRAAHAATERLSRQEHLVTTGTLAAGVGHEINNPLTYLMVNIGLAVEELQAIGGAPHRPG